MIYNVHHSASNTPTYSSLLIQYCTAFCHKEAYILKPTLGAWERSCSRVVSFPSIPGETTRYTQRLPLIELMKVTITTTQSNLQTTAFHWHNSTTGALTAEEVQQACAFTSLFFHSTPTLPYKFVHWATILITRKAHGCRTCTSSALTDSRFIREFGHARLYST